MHHKTRKAESLVIDDAIVEIHIIVGVVGFTVAVIGRIVHSVGIHKRTGKDGAYLYRMIGAINIIIAFTIITIASTKMHIAADMVIITISDIPIVPNTHVG